MPLLLLQALLCKMKWSSVAIQQHKARIEPLLTCFMLFRLQTLYSPWYLELNSRSYVNDYGPQLLQNYFRRSGRTRIMTITQYTSAKFFFPEPRGSNLSSNNLLTQSMLLDEMKGQDLGQHVQLKVANLQLVVDKTHGGDPI